MHAELCRYLFAPRSMAIVGASERNPYARSAMQRLDACGWRGRVHLVNPAAQTVFGRTSWPRATDLPEPIDMALVAVPRTAVLDVMRDCAAAGAKAAVIVSNGFGESHDALGRTLQAQLAAFLRDHPMAVCGPACLGVLSLRDGFQAFGGRPGVDILPGGVALVSQSGANVHTFIGAALARNIGFSYIVSSGNEVGLEFADYVDHFLDDPGTRAICAYVESFRTPARLLAVAQRALELHKPIVLLKIGRSESSARAALAHTGAMTGSDVFFDALFRQYGMLRADSIEEALDRVSVFGTSDRRWWPTRGRVGLVSISGGFAAALSDLSRDAGFDVPEFQPQTTAALSSILPPNVNPQNPIDISTQVQRDRPAAWQQALQAVASDARVDLLLDAEALPITEDQVRTLLDIRARTGKPVVLASTSPHIHVFDDALRALCRANDLPLVFGVEGARRALQSTLAYAQAAGVRHARPRPATPVTAIARPAVAVLHEVEARALLARFGIGGPRGELVDTPGAAARVAAMLGGNVALKVVSRDLPHRSERGLVMLDVPPADVAGAFDALQARLEREGVERAGSAMLVQAMVDGAAELLVGVTVQPGYPPLLVAGFGGVNVELLRDTATRICPVDVDEATRMLRELKLFPTLDGYRGRPRADVRAAAGAIAALSEFALAAGDWLAEAEINPLIVRREGDGVSAVDALVVVRSA